MVKSGFVDDADLSLKLRSVCEVSSDVRRQYKDGEKTI